MVALAKAARWHTLSVSGFELDIFKIVSWNHTGCTGNMIIKDFVREIHVPLENSAYFSDGDGVDSNPEFISSKP